MFRSSLPTMFNRSAIASTRSIRFLSNSNKPTVSATNFFIPRLQTSTTRSNAILAAVKQQRNSYNSSKSNSSNIFKLFFASAGASFLLTTSFAKSIYNDVAVATPRQQVASNVSVQPVTKTPTKTRFGDYLNYEELTIGSVTGLFLGIILGKLSQVFVFISLSSFLLVEFLQSRNIINVPWNYILTVGKQKINLKQLVFEKPSFKISFVLSLIIAAYNV
ncbi:hypothetical protein CORT_0A03620 [Candida orthopsilosis Co 90-125]|uniref:Uncharacterized protein n=1 Tax=Candida orthopsilosis (strain 90-125) TaxID=1136231 RepID=H8WWC6_CANO9|nr:hypothetical protein CORT_0A03620 [Candida orthopsilosis Co 90-125]CCG20750.1 hypothetical protein CORT_0A03620 [Candida orthopsilosis Co 90-125]